MTEALYRKSPNNPQNKISYALKYAKNAIAAITVNHHGKNSKLPNIKTLKHPNIKKTYHEQNDSNVPHIAKLAWISSPQRYSESLKRTVIPLTLRNWHVPPAFNANEIIVRTGGL